MTPKEIIDNYFTNNFDFLLQSATNCLKVIKKSSIKKLAPQLVSELYVWLIEDIKKPNTAQNIKNGLVEAICVNWMSTQCKWKQTRFKYLYVYNKSNVTDKPFNEVEQFIVDDSSTEEDHINNKRLEHINTIYNTLSYDKQILFKMRFIDHLPVEDIIKQTDLSQSTIYSLLKELKIILRKDIKYN